MRFLLSIIILSIGGVIYLKAGAVHHDAEAITRQEPEIFTPVAKIIEPEPLPEVKLSPVATESAPKPVIIPLKSKTASKRETGGPLPIILPSESDPNTDRIIAPSPLPKINNNEKYRIVVNKSNFTLSLLKGDELVKNYSIAVGKNTGDKERVGDHRTPVGKFKIVSIENASSWSHDFRDGKGKIAGAYGPWFLRLDAKGWRGIGIHGTHDPDSRGTNATEGCIRLSNEDIKELKSYAYRNMPVEIREN
ncbi:MAG: L,D-transpeptidase [Synergistaceae bacterium]|nr:L,D-transpeptidase [Synergistaceae bacterium]